MLGFSCLGPLASRVRGCSVWLGCWCVVGCVRWLQGLLDVWGESRGGESRGGGLRLCVGRV